MSKATTKTPKDRNGTQIVVGARAAVLSDDKFFNGKIGEVRRIMENTMFDKKMRVRVSKGPEDNFEWSIWVLPKDLLIVERAR